MKAVVYKDAYNVAVEEVPDPRIEDPQDVIIAITTSNICGSDLHMYEGRTNVEPPWAPDSARSSGTTSTCAT